MSRNQIKQGNMNGLTLWMKVMKTVESLDEVPEDEFETTHWVNDNDHGIIDRGSETLETILD
jgi:hypothetical protein